jgi:D-galactarolactone cycloisomerase
VKIESVTTSLLHTDIPFDQRVESGAGLKLARQMCLVRITTDTGLVGYGSPSGPYDLAVLQRLIEHVIGPLLVGEDVGEHARLWHHVYKGEVTRNAGNRGVGVAALSGIDMALWDLRGKAAGVPLHELLGGLYHPHGVRAYASSIYWALEPEEAAAQALSWIDRGFTAVKLKVGREPRRDAARVHAIRAAIGPDNDLLVDGNQSLSRHDALWLLGVLEEAGVYWFEEPLDIDDVEGHRLLREAARCVRIATGENHYTSNAFLPFVQAGAIDVLQADVSRAGGITEVATIQAMAKTHHLQWNPHTFNDILTVVANLQLVAASPHPAMFEWDITYNELMTHLTTEPIEVVGGLLHPPAGPGLGVEIDEDFVDAHVWSGERSIGNGHGMRV